ncbi:MAG TPA: M23 family metallopeptidase [Dyella sp.]|uniref:M23 family metallopeptidase n=1 Tax=Dyella sp. TaxID=1869338 RepID=UPI002D7A328E|nr:M23 family metallopeptidase [Dyella sp.]HET6552673.1 M23 family metallopeptidase [Dyella sp.]
MLRRIVLLAALALACAVAQAQRAPVTQSFDLRVPWTPEPVVVDGKASLVYELHFTSYARDPLRVKGIAVLDDDGRVLANVEGRALDAVLGRPDHPADKDLARMPPGVEGVAYLSVPFDRAAGSAAHLHHRISYASEAPSSSHASTEGGAFTVSSRAPLTLGPPLRGGPWVAIYSTQWERGHRRVLYAVDGAVHVPGRFAIDWIRLGEHGGFASGDGAKPTQWHGYGADVLAVTDAVVASTGEGIAESATLAEHAAQKVPLEDAAGNYVSLDLGDGRFAFYEHLRPGSITVKAGQHVRRGQVIGQLGFTGESTGPHLHFHIADRDAPLDAEGLPYVLQDFRQLGGYESIDAFGKGQPWSITTPVIHRDELPAPLSVVDFGDDARR